MANLKDITLRPGHATAKNIVLRALPVAAVVVTTIWLYPLHTTPKNIVLGDPTVVRGGGVAFPTQYAGLRTYYSGAVKELCLVATADAPSGMGAVPRVRKGGTTYAIYLVETTDPNASSVRIQTSAGTKSIRLKT